LDEVSISLSWEVLPRNFWPKGFFEEKLERGTSGKGNRAKIFPKGLVPQKGSKKVYRIFLMGVYTGRIKNFLLERKCGRRGETLRPRGGVLREKAFRKPASFSNEDSERRGGF